MERTILHCDCNAFYVSVETLLDPTLAEGPSAVCGDPESRRGIILAKNEKAKAFGVQTAETIWQARRKCVQTYAWSRRTGRSMSNIHAGATSCTYSIPIWLTRSVLMNPFWM